MLQDVNMVTVTIRAIKQLNQKTVERALSSMTVVTRATASKV